MAERATHLFQEKSWTCGATMGWMFTREEVLILVQIVGLWSRALRPGLPPCVIDRTTFCRLILDLGLVDQERVPFFWAVSLFDEKAKTLRCCPVEACSTSTSPIVGTINTWMLVCILDVIIRRLFNARPTGPVKKEIRTQFLLGLFDIARYRLPPPIIEDSELEADQVTKAIVQGRELFADNGGSDSGSGSEFGESINQQSESVNSPSTLKKRQVQD